MPSDYRETSKHMNTSNKTAAQIKAEEKVERVRVANLEEKQFVAKLDDVRATAYNEDKFSEEQVAIIKTKLAEMELADSKDSLTSLIYSRLRLTEFGKLVLAETCVETRELFKTAILSRCDQGSVHALILGLSKLGKLEEWAKHFNLSNNSSLRQKFEGKESPLDIADDGKTYLVALGWKMPKGNEAKPKKAAAAAEISIDDMLSF